MVDRPEAPSDTPAHAQGIGEALGPVIATVLGIGGLVAALPAGTVMALTVSGRHRADHGRPRLLHGVGVTVLVLSGLWALLFLVYAFPLGLVACAVHALPAIVLLRATGEGAAPDGAPT